MNFRKISGLKHKHYLFQQGEWTSTCYIVLSGEVTLSFRNQNKINYKIELLSILSRGNFVGLDDVLYKNPYYSYSAQFLNEGKVLAIEDFVLLKILKDISGLKEILFSIAKN